MAAGNKLGSIIKTDVQLFIRTADTAFCRFQNKIAADDIVLSGIGCHVINTFGTGNGNIFTAARFHGIDVDVFFTAEVDIIFSLQRNAVGMNVNVFALVHGYRITVFGNFQIVPFRRSNQQYLVGIRFRRKLGHTEGFAARIQTDGSAGFNRNVFAGNIRIFNHILRINHFSFASLENTVRQLAFVPTGAFGQFGFFGRAQLVAPVSVITRTVFCLITVNGRKFFIFCRFFGFQSVNIVIGYFIRAQSLFFAFGQFLIQQSFPFGGRKLKFRLLAFRLTRLILPVGIIFRFFTV